MKSASIMKIHVDSNAQTAGNHNSNSIRSLYYTMNINIFSVLFQILKWVGKVLPAYLLCGKQAAPQPSEVPHYATRPLLTQQASSLAFRGSLGAKHFLRVLIDIYRRFFCFLIYFILHYVSSIIVPGNFKRSCNQESPVEQALNRTPPSSWSSYSTG